VRHTIRSAPYRRPARIDTVHTGNVQIAGVIRMAVMRMTSWTNYLFFTA
jgi:hypothetical protein